MSYNLLCIYANIVQYCPILYAKLHWSGLPVPQFTTTSSDSDATVYCDSESRDWQALAESLTESGASWPAPAHLVIE